MACGSHQCPTKAYGLPATLHASLWLASQGPDCPLISARYGTAWVSNIPGKHGMAEQSALQGSSPEVRHLRYSATGSCSQDWRGSSIQCGATHPHHHRLASTPSLDLERELAIHTVPLKSTPSCLKASRNRGDFKSSTAAG